MRAAVAAGALLVVITEVLGLFLLLVPVAVMVCWLLALPAVLYFASRRWPAIGRLEWFAISPLAAIAALLAWIAWLAPPNTHDAMAYHLPRVVYWVQHASVENFATSYLMQLQMPPFAEYLTLHLWLLAGGDRLANFPQWGGFVGSILAVSVLAREYGASRLGQWFSALAAATLPNAILQATGSKNDCALSFWLLCACLFTRMALRTGGGFTLAAVSTALALLTKGTAYLFLPPLVVALVANSGFQRLRVFAGTTGLAVLLLNGCFYWRNFELSGSPLGFDSAHGDGRYRVRNDRVGADVTFSNAIRGLAGHIAFRKPEDNQRLHATILSWHAALGLDPNDPATTWRDSTFTPTLNSNHESNSPNRTHIALLLLAVAYSLWRRPLRWFAVGWLGSWLLFFTLLRWQPYMTRLHLPLFLTGAVFIGVWLDQWRPRFLAFAVCLLLVNGARPYLFDNWLRPLEGPGSLLETSRETLLFKDIEPLLPQADIVAAVSRIQQSDCWRVGIDANNLELSYPAMTLLLQRDPRYLFRPISVTNASRRFTAADNWSPCAVLCLQCDPNRELAGFNPADSFGRQRLFFPAPSSNSVTLPK